MTTICNSIPGRRRFLETLVAAPMAATLREHPAARAQTGVGNPQGNVDPSAVPNTIDTPLAHVLIIHLHADHYDPVAIRAIVRARCHTLCLREFSATVAADGLPVRGVTLHEPALLRGGALAVIAVEALDGQGDLQVSWIVSGGGKRIFHGGDTAWHFYWWKIALAYGPFDAVFLPINGVVVARTPPSGVPASLTPEQAAAAAHILRARVLCPTHYGDNSPPTYVEADNAEKRVVQACTTRGVRVEVVAPGQWLTW